MRREFYNGLNPAPNPTKMDITKNMKIEAKLVTSDFLDVYAPYYVDSGLQLIDAINYIDSINGVKKSWSSYKHIIVSLHNDDQSTIDDVLLDVDFVLTEMLNEKNKK
jgi:hypothetical protein